MSVAADTSVIVASFSSWHDKHATAVAAIQRTDALVAHCLVETYSLLTRMPPPYRAAPDVAAAYLSRAFARHTLFALSTDEIRSLADACASRGIHGGATYDALIASTCHRAGVRLLTLDDRARPTYAALGVDHELLA